MRSDKTSPSLNSLEMWKTVCRTTLLMFLHNLYSWVVHNTALSSQQTPITLLMFVVLDEFNSVLYTLKWRSSYLWLIYPTECHKMARRQLKNLIYWDSHMMCILTTPLFMHWAHTVGFCRSLMGVVRWLPR